MPFFACVDILVIFIFWVFLFLLSLVIKEEREWCLFESSLSLSSPPVVVLLRICVAGIFLSNPLPLPNISFYGIGTGRYFFGISKSTTFPCVRLSAPFLSPPTRD